MARNGVGGLRRVRIGHIATASGNGNEAHASGRVVDEDREKGRIASTASKRKASVEYAKSVLPAVQEAVRAVRRSDRGESLRAIADHLNANGVQTQNGKDFAPQTVSRLLYEIEDKVRGAAEFEFERAVAVLASKGQAVPVEVERLRAARDRIIAEGAELARALRVEGEDVPPPPALDQVAKLIVHQHDHRKRTGRWDETADDFPNAQQSFAVWSTDLLRRSL